MISSTLEVPSAVFERETGWAITPEGACKDGRCVPLPREMTDTVDLRVIAERLNMPLVRDEEAGLWCLGPEAGGRALTSAVAPDVELPDWRGATFQLDSLRGSKVLLVCWASW